MIRSFLAMIIGLCFLAGATHSDAAAQSNKYSLRVDFYLVKASDWVPIFRGSEFDFSKFEKLRTITSGDKYHLIAHVFDEQEDLNSVCLVVVEYVAGEILKIGRYGDDFCYRGLSSSATLQPRVKQYRLGAKGAGLSVTIDDLQFDFNPTIEFVDTAVEQ